LNISEELVIEKWNTPNAGEGRVFAAVFAHSDDLAIFAGGTVMKLISEGYKGYFIKTTNDEMDSYDLSFAETIYRIDRETHEVVNFLKLEKLYSLDYKNHYLEHSQLTEIRHRLITLFRFLRVDTVITFDPWGHYEENPDHYITGQAVETASWTAGRQLDLPELKDMGLLPKFVTQKYLVARGPQQVNRIVDISPVAKQKLECMKLHITPMDNMYRTYLDLHPDTSISQVDFIEKEFLQKADPIYGAEYVEKFHYINEEAPFSFIRHSLPATVR
jgi:LmbE family N-acetylglucosaminyl deacetylase